MKPQHVPVPVQDHKHLSCQYYGDTNKSDFSILIAQKANKILFHSFVVPTRDLRTLPKTKKKTISAKFHAIVIPIIRCGGSWRNSHIHVSLWPVPIIPRLFSTWNYHISESYVNKFKASWRAECSFTVVVNCFINLHAIPIRLISNQNSYYILTSILSI